MSRDLTAQLRDELLRDDHARAGKTYVPVEPVMDNEAADFTGSEIKRLLSDSDEQARQKALQAANDRARGCALAGTLP